MRILMLCALMLVQPILWAADNEDSLDVAHELKRARALIDAKKFDKAVRNLNLLVHEEKSNADAWNLLGYSHRKLGHYEKAAKAYEKSLTYNPDHKGALEYQGELHILQNDLASARLNLARLTALCPDGCEERTDLQEAVSAAGG